MHIPEGIVSVPVLVAGSALAAGGVGLGLKRMDDDRIPVVATLAAAFFVASLIHVPVGVSSVHLLLNGLAGIILGWTAFPALLVGLTMQAILFGHGGVTVLGVNVVVMALPGVICRGLFARQLVRPDGRSSFAWSFAAGATAVALTGVLYVTALMLSGREFIRPAQLVLLAHIPVMAVEGLITASVLTFLTKVRPEMLRPILATEVASDEC